MGNINTVSPALKAMSATVHADMGTKEKFRYSVNAVAGGLAAGLTHFLVIPLDVVKTKIQLDPARYLNASSTVRILKGEHGILRGLSLGMGPTNYGYFIQGVCKYGFYELFKENVYHNIGSENMRNILSAASSEFIGDVLLTPFEAARIRMVAFDTQRVGTFKCMTDILRSEGLAGLYRGFLPLILKQIPYTASKLAVYEFSGRKIEKFYRKASKDNSEMRPVPVTIAAAIIGGLVSAVVSHPADTLLTRINRAQGLSIASSVKEAVAEGVWTGLRPRLVMVGGLASLQLLVYEASRNAISATLKLN